MAEQSPEGRWWRRLDGQPGWWPQSSVRASRRRTWVVEHPVVAWVALAAWMLLFQVVMGLVTGTMSLRYIVVANLGAAFFATFMVVGLRFAAPRPREGRSASTD